MTSAWEVLAGQWGVINGELSDGTANEVMAWYDPATDSWTVNHPNFHDSRLSSFAVETEEPGVFWIVGGKADSSGQTLRPTFEADFNTFEDK